MESIKIKNFRSIKNSGNINISPLTVVLGRNSSGKSSFLRLFPLLKQTVENKTSEPFLWYGDYVDFGNFNTVSYKMENKPIEISFTLKNSRSSFLHSFTSLDENVIFDIKLIITEKQFKSIQIKFCDQSIIINIDKRNNAKVIINNEEHCFKDYKLTINKIKKYCLIPNILGTYKNEKYTYPFFTEIGEQCRKKIFNNSNNTRLISLREFVCSKEYLLNKLKKYNKKKFGIMTTNNKSFNMINNSILAYNIDSIIDSINDILYYDIENFKYLKPIRAMVNRYYRIQGTSVDDLDSDGSNLPMILNNLSTFQLQEFEKWCKAKFNIVFSVDKNEGGHISLIVKNDIKDKNSFNVADTGYGYSQMLPIIVLLWLIHNKNYKGRYEDKLIVIEQPELHLHPAIQAKMIDLFVKVINEAEKQEIGIKFIIETHSETMINRIGTLINKLELDAKKVNILVFNKDNNETKIETKNFDENGLLKEWPIDFFSIN